jgi:rhodanese-related sulfurtransferase
MKFSSLASKAILAVSIGRAQGFSSLSAAPRPSSAAGIFSRGTRLQANDFRASTPLSRSKTSLMSSSSHGPTLQNIGKEEMEEIIEDYENGGREDSGYILLDVREEGEIAFTGKLSPNTITFPLQKLMQLQAFEMDGDDFQMSFGFEKPRLDETLVFSCAAGVRSVHAANFAAEAGYTKLVNYRGGANEWFSTY